MSADYRMTKYGALHTAGSLTVHHNGIRGCGPDGNLECRPVVVLDPEAILPGWSAENVPSLLEACAQIVVESTAPREVHETTLLLNLVKAFDAALGTGLGEPTDPKARVTDRRDNIWRLLADGEWVCTSGPDIGEYLTWAGLTERGPLGVMDQ